MEQSKSFRVALLGALIALSLVLSYVEVKIPVFVAVPGMKMGLANIAVIVSLYLLGNKSAIAVNVIRVILVFLLFGNSVGLMYSISGAVLSLLVMIILKISKKFSMVVISIAGGVCHNGAQIIVAVFLTNVTALYWYLIILWFTGIVSGALIGMAGFIITSRLKKIMQ